MTAAEATAVLEFAVQLSHELISAADGGNFDALARLGAERLALLKAFRAESRAVAAADRALWDAISALNDRALGLTEHQLRIKAREIDLAAVGRRAVTAYSANGMLR